MNRETRIRKRRGVGPTAKSVPRRQGADHSRCKGIRNVITLTANQIKQIATFVSCEKHLIVAMRMGKQLLLVSGTCGDSTFPVVKAAESFGDFRMRRKPF